MKLPNLCLFIIGLFAIVIVSCEKKIIGQHLDTNQTTIDDLEDLQALLDNMVIMEEVPSLGEISSDDFYVLDSTFGSINRNELNAFTWQREIFEGRGNVGDWNLPFQQVFYANTVLDALNKMQYDETSADLDRIKGSALFIRAFAYFQLSQIFTPTFDSVQSSTDLGLPIRLSPNPEIPSVRSNNKVTYERIIFDLNEACRLLPSSIDVNRKNRPSQSAAYGLLARTYLIMGDYATAKLYADSSLLLYATLTDFNDIVANSRPFTPNQPEILYQAHLLSTTEILKCASTIIDSNLYKSYDNNDLRKELFFKKNQLGLPVSNYTFSGTVDLFAGLATGEIYLIRAECLARFGDVGAALQDWNTLLRHRMKKGSFNPVMNGTPIEVLHWILLERRKELIFRGLRWSDIRRFNRQKDTITLTRVYNGEMYSLQPNSSGYVLPIPPDVIRLSGILQNPR